MKVLHIINGLGAGGAERLISDIIPLMNRKNGVEVEVLLLTDEKNVFKEKLEENGVKVDVVPYRKMYSPLNVFYIRKYIIKGNYDVVHAHLFPTQYWVGLTRVLLKLKGVKFITTEHSSYNRRRTKFYFRYLDRYIYSKYDGVISVSEKVHFNLIEWLKIPKEKLDKFVVINNGINVEKFKQAKPYEKKEIHSGLNSETKLICMVGRFSESKDQGTLIRALKELPKNVCLLLVGEGPLKQQNIKLAEGIGVIQRVFFLGYRDDVERILKTSDIIVLSSYWEGFGLAIVEGMAAIKPCVASCVDGLKEIVKGYGLLFEQGNYMELSEVLWKVISNSKLSREVSAKCFKRANDFDIKRTVKMTMELYKKIGMNGKMIESVK